MAMILAGERYLSADALRRLEENSGITAEAIDADLTNFISSGPQAAPRVPPEKQNHRPACPCALCSS